MNNYFIPILVIIATSCTKFHEDEVPSQGIEINFAQDTRVYEPFTNYINSSVRQAPPPGLDEIIEKDIGPAHIIRCTLILDNLWDYRSDEYDFNFKIGQYKFHDDSVKFHYWWDTIVETDYNYEDYLRSYSDSNREIMLVVINYHREVVEGTITIDKWKEVFKNSVAYYKSNFPNVSYIEVLNETAIEHFGGLTDQEYYMFYQKAYEAINEINNELNPLIPLKVGGPTSAGAGLTLTDIDTSVTQADIHNKLQKIYLFLRNFSEDQNPNKRLDFISFHEYSLGNKRPKEISQYQGIIENLLSDLSLDTDITIMIDEAGINPINSSLVHATGILTMHEYLKNSENIKLFPWVTYHTTRQRNWVMYDANINRTAFGMIGTLVQFHQNQEVFTKSYEVDENGFGVHVTATKSDTLKVLQFWNFSDQKRNLSVKISDLDTDIVNYDITEFKVDKDGDVKYRGIKGSLEFEPFTGITSPNSIEIEIGPYHTHFYKMKKR